MKDDFSWTKSIVTLVFGVASDAKDIASMRR